MCLVHNAELILHVSRCVFSLDTILLFVLLGNTFYGFCSDIFLRLRLALKSLTFTSQLWAWQFSCLSLKSVLEHRSAPPRAAYGYHVNNRLPCPACCAAAPCWSVTLSVSIGWVGTHLNLDTLTDTAAGAALGQALQKPCFMKGECSPLIFTHLFCLSCSFRFDLTWFVVKLCILAGEEIVTSVLLWKVVKFYLLWKQCVYVSVWLSSCAPRITLSI